MLILLNSSEELEPRESEISEVTEQVRGRAGTSGDHWVCLSRVRGDLPFTFLPTSSFCFFVLFWCRTKRQEEGENLFEKIIKGKEKRIEGGKSEKFYYIKYQEMKVSFLI